MSNKLQFVGFYAMVAPRWDKSDKGDIYNDLTHVSHNFFSKFGKNCATKPCKRPVFNPFPVPKHPGTVLGQFGTKSPTNFSLLVKTLNTCKLKFTGQTWDKEPNLLFDAGNANG